MGRLTVWSILVASLSLDGATKTTAYAQPEQQGRDFDGCGAQQRAIITGISGMIGSHIARALLIERPCVRVYGLVRPREDLSALRGVINDVHLVAGDIADGVRLKTVIHEIKPHFVYHMAAQAMNGISYAVPELTIDVNVRGTLNLLEALRDSKQSWGQSVDTRVLIAGSSTEYGRTADTWQGQALPENAPLVPISPYGVSKLATESLATQYFYAHGVKAVTARFFIQSIRAPSPVLPRQRASPVLTRSTRAL
eukprot:6083550-Prymnesium_polylepis.1